MKKIMIACSFVSFVVFLMIGLLPSLLYGGYMGLALAGAMFGTPIEPTLMAKIITVGGMGFGMLSVGFLFVIAGAFCGFLLAKLGSLVRVSIAKIHTISQQ